MILKSAWLDKVFLGRIEIDEEGVLLLLFQIRFVLSHVQLRFPKVRLNL